MNIDQIILQIQNKFENNPILILVPIFLLLITIIFIFSSGSKKSQQQQQQQQSATATDNITDSKKNKKDKKKNPSPTLQSNNNNNSNNNQKYKHVDTPIPSPPLKAPTATATSSTTSSSNNNTATVTDTKTIPIQENKLFFKVFRGGDIVNSIKFSEDGKYLSFCGDDRSIKMYIWDSLINSKVPQSFNLQLPFDNATCISWGNKSIYATLNESQKLVSFNILDQKNAQGKSYESGFSVNLEQPKPNIKSICSSIQSPYILTCSGDDCIIKIFNLKGQLIQTINNGQIKNYMASMSPDGRFFAVASFTSEVKIYECFKKKDGSIDQLKRVMSLSGYKTSIYSVGFSSDSLKIVTSSKDSSIKLWNINVNYKLEVDPECIYSITSEIGVLDMIAISPDSQVIAGVNQNSNIIGFFNLSNGNLIDSIHLGIHNTKVNSIAWSMDSKYLVSGGNDKLLYIWSNPKKLQ